MRFKPQFLVIAFFILMIQLPWLLPGAAKLYGALGYSVPTARYDIEDIVPIEELRRIADQHAYEVWGSRLAPGPPFPLVNQKGSVRAYVFTYRLDANLFPTFDSIFEVIHALRAKHRLDDITGRRRPGADFYAELERRLGRFGSIVTSATKENFPILAVYHSLHPYFLFAEVAQEKARRLLDQEDLWLDKIYFLEPHEQYFGFTLNEKKILLHIYSLKASDPEKVFAGRGWPTLNQALERRRTRAWRTLTAGGPNLIPEDEVGFSAHSQAHSLLQDDTRRRLDVVVCSDRRNHDSGLLG